MVEVSGLSDPGCVRKNNEDWFIIDLPIRGFHPGGRNGRCQWWRVCFAFSVLRCCTSFSDTFPVLVTLATLEQGFVEANSAVRRAARDNPELQGMGTTLIAAREIGEGHFQIGSVGDSRAYHCSADSPHGFDP